MADARHDFLGSFAMHLMSIRPDEWNKFMGSDETVAVLDEFFRQQDMLELVLGLNPAGQLQATPCFPPALRGKGVYFVKEKKESITQENCRSGLLVGDIGPSPLEHFITVVEEVGSPLGLVLEVGSEMLNYTDRSCRRHRPPGTWMRR
ncbi:dynein axonemal heavy chain 17-like [Amazona ochrocephala]